MTDNYGSDPHDHDESLGEDAHEQGAVREAPSSYEFAGDHDGHGATVDAEHSEEADTGMPAEQSASRRSPLLPIAAAVGVALLLGAVAWWQFGGNSLSVASDAPVHPMTMPVPPSAAAPPPASPAPDLAAAPVAPKTGSENPMAAVPPPATLPNMVGAIPPLPSIQFPPPADPNAAPAAAAPVAAPVASAPVAAVTPAAPVPAAPVPAAPVVVSVSAPAVPHTPGADPRIEALTARIDSLQTQLDHASQQMGQVTNMVAASATAPASTGAMQERLDKMEQQLAALNHTAPGLTVPAAGANETQIVAVPSVTKKTASFHVVGHKPVHKMASKNAKKTPPVKEAAQEPPPQWVLRAAMPGQAWIAPDATSHDLKQVHVGDTLPGIGRVMAIQTQGGGTWVVKGAKGSIQ